MVDETTDISTKEQVVFALCWIDDDWSVHEDFVGLIQTDSIDSNSLVHIIRDVLLRLDLKLENCRGQCYDGASNMKGCRKGVATQIMSEEPCAIYTHCYGHSLNLACQDEIRVCACARVCVACMCVLVWAQESLSSHNFVNSRVV